MKVKKGRPPRRTKKRRGTKKGRKSSLKQFPKWQLLLALIGICLLILPAANYVSGFVAERLFAGFTTSEYVLRIDQAASCILLLGSLLLLFSRKRFVPVCVGFFFIALSLVTFILNHGMIAGDLDLARFGAFLFWASLGS